MNSEEQARIILKWITGEKCSEEVLNGIQKLENIHPFLKRLKEQNNNTLPRLLNVDRKIIKKNLSDPSWDLLETFMKENEDTEIQCHSCKDVFIISDISFQCTRCLLWYHTHCESFQSVQTFVICKNCFYIRDDI